MVGLVGGVVEVDGADGELNQELFIGCEIATMEIGAHVFQKPIEQVAVQQPCEVLRRSIPPANR